MWNFFPRRLSDHGSGEGICLGVLCRVQYDGGGQVEDAAGALDRRPHGGRVEEVHLEQPEPRARAVQGPEVLRLALVLCTGFPIRLG